MDSLQVVTAVISALAVIASFVIGIGQIKSNRRIASGSQEIELIQTHNEVINRDYEVQREKTHACEQKCLELETKIAVQNTQILELTAEKFRLRQQIERLLERLDPARRTPDERPPDL